MQANQKRILTVVLIGFLLIGLLCVQASADVSGEWVIRGGKRRYRTSSGYLKNTVAQIDGQYYAFNKKGLMCKGWVFYKKNKYYFSKETGAAVIGVFTVGQSMYCTNEKGILQRGGFFIYDGQLYYASGTGRLTFGKTFTVNRQQYYAFPDGHLMRNGWYGGEYYDSRGRVAAETFLYDPSLSGQLSVSNLKENGIDHCSKLMIVAHPDDETLWGGAHLSEGGYFVLCITNQSYQIRANEFAAVMRASGNYGMILDYPDYYDITTRTKSRWIMQKVMIARDVDLLLDYKNWKLVATHNPDGEYGHKHHQLTGSIVSQCFFSKAGRTGELWYFGKYYKKEALAKLSASLKKVPASALKVKKACLDIYANEDTTIAAHAHMNPYENWVKAEDWWK